MSISKKDIEEWIVNHPTATNYDKDNALDSIYAFDDNSVFQCADCGTSYTMFNMLNRIGDKLVCDNCLAYNLVCDSVKISVNQKDQYSDQVRLDNAVTRAIKQYGWTTELLVAMEELNELAAVVAKIPRYETIYDARADEDLRNRVLDECADVLIVMEYILRSMRITDYEATQRINKKLDRLEKWLDTGEGIAISTKIRE